MILLFSGGVDSYIAYHFYGKPRTLYFDLHTKYSDVEKEVVRKLIPNTIVESCVDFSTREQETTAFIPYRNLHLALLANKYSDTIAIAGVKDDMVNDKNELIFTEFSALMSHMMNREIRVISPFWNLTKAQVVKWFLNNGGTEKELLSTISCYTPSEEGTECHECPACFRKWNALAENGIDVPFYNDDLMLEYLVKAVEGRYVPERNDSIIKQVLEKHPEWKKKIMES